MDRREVMLQRMVRRIGQAAAQGSGEVHEVLQQFGLYATDLVKLDPSKQFELIRQHMNDTPKGSLGLEKLAATVVLFDTEGAIMLKEGWC